MKYTIEWENSIEHTHGITSFEIDKGKLNVVNYGNHSLNDGELKSIICGNDALSELRIFLSLDSRRAYGYGYIKARLCLPQKKCLK